ncbi:hypothetical protein ACF08N_10140 [Streptomyces sp. NPDC015127]|uniref:hypothetical protein n=1 Tax=Streptomyces sp. NPDC015127 TaxID=3364939 RepID=UPI0036FC1A51
MPARPSASAPAHPSAPRRGRRRIPRPAAAPAEYAAANAPGRTVPSSVPSPVPSSGPAADAASDVVRWAAFTCLLVPVVLVVYGTSVGGAAAAALGLAAVTTACRVLLRHSEREAAHVRARRGVPQRSRRARAPEGARRGAHRGPGSAPGD